MMEEREFFGNKAHRTDRHISSGLAATALRTTIRHLAVRDENVSPPPAHRPGGLTRIHREVRGERVGNYTPRPHISGRASKRERSVENGDLQMSDVLVVEAP